MRDINNCDPQLGQRRLAIGGNGGGSKLFGCGTDALPDARVVSQSPTPDGQSRGRWCFHSMSNQRMSQSAKVSSTAH